MKKILLLGLLPLNSRACPSPDAPTGAFSFSGDISFLSYNFLAFRNMGYDHYN